MNPKERLAWALETYNSEYDKYQAVAPLALTDEERQIMRVKKAVLVELEPLLQTYIEYVELGRVPEAGIIRTEQQMIRLVERLLAATIVKE